MTIHMQKLRTAAVKKLHFYFIYKRIAVFFSLVSGRCYGYKGVWDVFLCVLECIAVQFILYVSMV